MQATHPQNAEKPNQQTPYTLFAAYLHTVPLEELIESVERARRDAQLRYVVLYGALCSYCLSRVARLDGSYLRTFALELKEQLAQILASYVSSILAQPRVRINAEESMEPPIRQIATVFQQVTFRGSTLFWIWLQLLSVPNKEIPLNSGAMSSYYEILVVTEYSDAARTTHSAV